MTRYTTSNDTTRGEHAKPRAVATTSRHRVLPRGVPDLSWIPRGRALARLVALSAVAAVATSAPADAASPFAPLQRSISENRAVLGKANATVLRRHVRLARAAYDDRHWCRAYGELGTTARKAGRLKGARRKAPAARIVGRAQSLQRRVFLAHAATSGYCGMPKPKVRVSPGLGKSLGEIPALADGHPRRIAALGGPSGTTQFVVDEVVVMSNDSAAVAAFAKRWDGKVLRHADGGAQGKDSWVLRIDASSADTAGLADDLRAADPSVHGNARVSSTAALRLVAVAADAAADGLAISPNFLSHAARVLDRTTTEEAGLNAYGLWYNDTAFPRISTGEAWRALEIGGLTGNRVKLAVLDGGFSSAPVDLSSASSGAFNGTENAMKCTGGKSCPWHGTNVASAAASVVDNGAGVAGSGGQVADVLAVTLDGTLGSEVFAVTLATANGAKVINISNGYSVDAFFWPIAQSYQLATSGARAAGALVVAAAGNDNEDVDADAGPWEESWTAPCENEGVLCVGGIDADGKRNASSNYGYESCEDPRCDVDIFAPYSVLVGPDPKVGTNHLVGGTSFSAPLVAGVAAMVLAANPKLGPAGVESILTTSAHWSSDDKVGRTVDAYAAVRKAAASANKPLGPLVEASSPSPDLTAPYGVFKVPFSAKVYWVEDPTCCTLKWSSNVDGPMGQGPSIGFAFPGPGARNVTVTAKDGKGGSATDTLAFTSTNLPPKPSIGAPSAGQKVLRGQTIVLKGSASDPNELAGVPCSGLQWARRKGSGPLETLGNGCSLVTSFPSSGNWSVELTADDGHGAVVPTKTAFSVIDPAPGSPPLVTIVAPQPEDYLLRTTPVTLSATAIDPDGGATVVGTWSVKVGDTTTVIGSGNTRTWLPSDQVPDAGCHTVYATLIFSATDSDDTSTTQVDVGFMPPPC